MLFRSTGFFMVLHEGFRGTAWEECIRDLDDTRLAVCSCEIRELCEACGRESWGRWAPPAPTPGSLRVHVVASLSSFPNSTSRRQPTSWGPPREKSRGSVRVAGWVAGYRTAKCEWGCLGVGWESLVHLCSHRRIQRKAYSI